MLVLQAYLQRIKRECFSEVVLDIEDHEVETILEDWFNNDWPHVKSQEKNQDLPMLILKEF